MSQNQEYKSIIGLEIHVELKTKSKMFCQCDGNYFGKKPNSNTCPVCLGLPGALPVPNKKAIEWTMMIGRAFNCKINKSSKFDRKHYFYPDLPKGYQISQYDQPIASNGFSEIKYLIDSNKLLSKKFRIQRVHLEEDTAKLIHFGSETLIDFNRSGVPLVEIVTEPDFDNSDDVKRFLEELQVVIRYLNVSDADMEKGSMRLEPNISVAKVSLRTRGFELPSYKVEVKNINSFSFVKKAIEYEVKRQIEILEKNEAPVQETRGFDEDKGKTYSQRSKEQAHDYRYFPEPDIPLLVFSDDYIKAIDRQIPELPGEKVERYADLGLRYSDAHTITRSWKLAKYFDEVSSKLKAQISKLNLKTQILNQNIVNYIINKKIPTSLSIDEFVSKAIELLTPIETNEKELDILIYRLIEKNKKVVDNYKSGKENAIMFLVGQVMREMKGRADAKIVIKKLKKQLSNT